MRTRFLGLALAILMATLTEAEATFHLWQVVEVYSNASGSVQFIELLTTSNGQDEFVANNAFISSGSHNFPFPTNPTSSMTANRHLLIATPSYFALPGVPPADYNLGVDNFFSVNGDTINFSDVNNLTFTAGQLPTDGAQSLNRAYGGSALTTSQNSPTNFAGTSGTIGPFIHRRLDFNADEKPDFLLINSARQTAIWHLNGTALIDGVYGPQLPSGWSLISVNEFNHDGKSDLVLFNPTTRRTALWLLNGSAFFSSSYGPTLPSGWELRSTSDFNADGKPDFVLTNASGQTAIWFLNGITFASGQFGPTLPPGWTLVAVGDFNADTHPDFVLSNASSRQTAIWFLNGSSFVSGSFGPTLPAGWTVVGSDDYNTDGNPDLILFQPTTRQSAVWFMEGAARIGSGFGPTLPNGYSLIAR